jgi:hypothetical protein
MWIQRLRGTGPLSRHLGEHPIVKTIPRTEGPEPLTYSYAHDPDRFRRWEHDRLSADIDAVTNEIAALRQFLAFPAASVTEASERLTSLLFRETLTALTALPVAEIADRMERWLDVATLDVQSPDIEVLKRCRQRFARLRRRVGTFDRLHYVVRSIELHIEHEKRMAETYALIRKSDETFAEIRARLAERGIYVDNDGDRIDPPKTSTRDERIAAATDEGGVFNLADFIGTKH